MKYLTVISMFSMVLLGCSQQTPVPPQPTGTQPNSNVSLANEKAIGTCYGANNSTYPGDQIAYHCVDSNYWCGRSSPTCYTTTCDGRRYSSCCSL